MVLLSVGPWVNGRFFIVSVQRVIFKLMTLFHPVADLTKHETNLLPWPSKVLVTLSPTNRQDNERHEGPRGATVSL